MNDQKRVAVADSVKLGTRLVIELAASLERESRLYERNGFEVISLPIFARTGRPIEIGFRVVGDEIELNDLEESFKTLYLGGMDMDDQVTLTVLTSILQEYRATQDGYVIKGRASLRAPAEGLWSFVACLLKIEECAEFRHYPDNSMQPLAQGVKKAVERAASP